MPRNLKRSAPDSSEPQQQQQQPASYQPQNMYSDSTYQNNPIYQAPFFPDANYTGGDVQENQLVRRNPNHQLTLAHQLPQQLSQQSQELIHRAPDLYPDDAALQKEAAEAQAKAGRNRKKLPPFLEKLRIFMDKYADYIVWDDDGRSFFIKNDEEFQKDVLPILFKHQNLSSFVRQLNMYGFHKVVGAEDNSLNAARDKTKAKNRYENFYFRRGRPDWVWLIRKKPKKVDQDKTGKRRPRKGKSSEPEDEFDDDDDDEDDAADHDAAEHPPAPTATSSTDIIPVTRHDWDIIRSEVTTLLKNNINLTATIARLERSNEDVKRQIIEAQKRHQGSLQGLVSYLASFIQTQLIQQGGSGNMQAIVNSMQQHANNQSNAPVVDLSNMPDMNLTRPKQQLRIEAAPSSRSQYYPSTIQPSATIKPNQTSMSFSPEFNNLIFDNPNGYQFPPEQIVQQPTVRQASPNQPPLTRSRSLTPSSHRIHELAQQSITLSPTSSFHDVERAQQEQDQGIQNVINKVGEFSPNPSFNVNNFAGDTSQSLLDTSYMDNFLNGTDMTTGFYDTGTAFNSDAQTFPSSMFGNIPDDALEDVNNLSDDALLHGGIPISHNRVKSVSSRAASPVDTIEENDETPSVVNSPRKKRRTG
jgi:hypothetical protein